MVEGNRQKLVYGCQHLHNVDAILLQVNDLITESESKLLGLDGLVNVDTREGPAKAGNRPSKHALHGLLRNRSSILALLDGHRGRAGDIADNDGRADAARAVRLNPGVLKQSLIFDALQDLENIP